MSTVMMNEIETEAAVEAPATKPTGSHSPVKALNPNEAYFIAAQTGLVTPCGSGAPGIAKTAQILALAKLTKRRVYVLIGSLREPADIGGYPDKVITIRDGKETVYMALVPPKWAQETYEYEDDWIIVCDELTSNSPAVQTALMGVVAEKKAGDLYLPDSCWVLALCNPPEIAANGHELEPPMANRLYHHPWRTDWAAIEEGWGNGFQFPEPNLLVLPDNWKDNYDEAGMMLKAYRSVNPGAFEPQRDAEGNITTPREELCMAWASARSWTNFGYLMAADLALGVGDGIIGQHARGCVGTATGDEFMQWRGNLDLTPPEPVIAEFIAAAADGREPHYAHPDCPSKVIIFLSSIVNAVKGKNTLERWTAGMGVMECAAREEVDIAMIAGRKMIVPEMMPDGAEVSDKFTDTLFPLLTRVIHHHE